MAPSPTVNSTVEFSAEEMAFLSKTASFGVDWIKTRAEYEGYYGKRLYYGWKQAVALPATTAFSHNPLNFYICTDPRLADLPPQYFVAHFDEHSDSRINFAEMENQLIAALGEGIRQDASNCLCRRWTIGIFEVKLFAWPADIQSKWLEECTVPGGQNSGTRSAAMIAIESRFSYIFPDNNLTR